MAEQLTQDGLDINFQLDEYANRHKDADKTQIMKQLVDAYKRAPASQSYRTWDDEINFLDGKANDYGNKGHEDHKLAAEGARWVLFNVKHMQDARATQVALYGQDSLLTAYQQVAAHLNKDFINTKYVDYILKDYGRKHPNDVEKTLKDFAAKQLETYNATNVTTDQRAEAGRNLNAVQVIEATYARSKFIQDIKDKKGVIPTALLDQNGHVADLRGFILNSAGAKREFHTPDAAPELTDAEQSVRDLAVASGIANRDYSKAWDALADINDIEAGTGTNKTKPGSEISNAIGIVFDGKGAVNASSDTAAHPAIPETPTDKLPKTLDELIGGNAELKAKLDALKQAEAALPKGDQKDVAAEFNNYIAVRLKDRQARDALQAGFEAHGVDKTKSLEAVKDMLGEGFDSSASDEAIKNSGDITKSIRNTMLGGKDIPVTPQQAAAVNAAGIAYANSYNTYEGNYWTGLERIDQIDKDSQGQPLKDVKGNPVMAPSGQTVAGIIDSYLKEKPLPATVDKDLSFLKGYQLSEDGEDIYPLVQLFLKAHPDQAKALADYTNQKAAMDKDEQTLRHILSAADISSGHATDIVRGIGAEQIEYTEDDKAVKQIDAAKIVNEALPDRIKKALTAPAATPAPAANPADQTAALTTAYSDAVKEVGDKYLGKLDNLTDPSAKQLLEEAQKQIAADPDGKGDDLPESLAELTQDNLPLEAVLEQAKQADATFPAKMDGFMTALVASQQAQDDLVANLKAQGLKPEEIEQKIKDIIVASAKDTVTPGTPATDAPAPVTGTPAPASTTPAPAAGTPAPVTGTPAPATTTPAPAAGAPTPAPVTGTPAPATTTPAPAAGASTPAPVTGTPAPVTGTPAPATTTPAPTTPAPVAANSGNLKEATAIVSAGGIINVARSGGKHEAARKEVAGALADWITNDLDDEDKQALRKAFRLADTAADADIAKAARIVDDKGNVNHSVLDKVTRVYQAQNGLGVDGRVGAETLSSLVSDEANARLGKIRSALFGQGYLGGKYNPWDHLEDAQTDPKKQEQHEAVDGIKKMLADIAKQAKTQVGDDKHDGYTAEEDTRLQAFVKSVESGASVGEQLKAYQQATGLKGKDGVFGRESYVALKMDDLKSLTGGFIDPSETLADVRRQMQSHGVAHHVPTPKAKPENIAKVAAPAAAATGGKLTDTRGPAGDAAPATPAPAPDSQTPDVGDGLY